MADIVKKVGPSLGAFPKHFGTIFTGNVLFVIYILENRYGYRNKQLATETEFRGSLNRIESTVTEYGNRLVKLETERDITQQFQNLLTGLKEFLSREKEK